MNRIKTYFKTVIDSLNDRMYMAKLTMFYKGKRECIKYLLGGQER